ncbi:MAG: adenosylcobinamide-GDP ribazoletransferase [Nitrosopumilus sp. H8]|nr:MAG: adenosylcobinamide-GDP ribazoletransferase [Nitrosopumilus sp. H13]RNJ80160.1 MAG: adenosylcobinamide-GDP ribazoletransferase [Nitrosopumilus sp. H8]
MLRGIGSVFSFLTIIPSSDATLENIAKNMYLFPVAGIAIGLVVGALGFGLSLAVDPLIVGLLVAASIAILTGIHHADGLADFADGLMVRGNKSRKLAAMKDVSTGSAGTVGIVLYMVGLIIAISLAGGTDLFRALLISEVLAKFAMVLMASLGSPAAPGSNSPFASAMRDRKKLAVAAAITLILVVGLGGAAGLLMLAASMILVILLLGISARSFGGITGDVLGATNELARLASLVVFVSV